MLLEIKDLKVSYKRNNALAEVVRGVNLNVRKGECVGLVGESGCGKTTVGLSITKLIPERKGKITSGSIFLDGIDLLALDSDKLRRVRGKKISYVFQEPFSSLNPVFTIHDQIKECLRGKEDTDARIAEILRSVGLEKISGAKKTYPHELSGGMQQRVMIAMAIASGPELLVLDEPTTALDVTVQKQILDLVIELKNKFHLSILFISHDLNMLFSVVDRVAVMYAGRIVEEGLKNDIVSRPAHPYTIGLIESIPSAQHRKQRFNAIEGRAPLFSELPSGCKFHPRCLFKIDACVTSEPELASLSREQAHLSRCIRAEEVRLNGINKGN